MVSLAEQTTESETQMGLPFQADNATPQSSIITRNECFLLFPQEISKPLAGFLTLEWSGTALLTT